MKYILLVGDGMGDLPIPELGNKTPLESAEIPTIDHLASKGELLLVKTVPEGYKPGSDVANLSLLGYEPEKYYTGRAPLEAASMGVKIAPDEIAYRCNLVTIDQTDTTITMRDFSGGHISTPEAEQLIKAVQSACGNDKLTFHAGISYRHLLVYKNNSPPFETVPPHDFMDKDVTEFYNEYLGNELFRELMEKSSEILREHPVNKQRVQKGLKPANSLWPWGEGRPVEMESFYDRYGLTGSLISAVDLLKGIGVNSGLEIINVEGATGYLDTNYEGKANAALKALKEKDFALVHVEAPDEAGHQGLIQEKKQAIEDFDLRIVKPIFEEMTRRRERFRLVVTMDHYTPLSKRTHEDWPVPMVLYDSEGVQHPSGLDYTESNVKKAVEGTELALDSGTAFIQRLFSIRD